MGTVIKSGRTPDLGVLVSFESGYRAYQGTLAAAVRILRPTAEVITVEPEDLGGAVKRFNPDIVIGSPLQRADLEGVPAWVDLSLDPAQPSEVSVNGCHSQMINPTLDKLLAIIEEIAPPSLEETAGAR